jgi:hypothetical protein
MTFTEQELHDIVEMVLSGISIEIAKEKIVASYRSSDFDKATKIERAVMKHFNTESLIPLSRQTEDIMPMQVYAYLLNDLIKGSIPKDVRDKFIKTTTRDRLSLYHYTKQYNMQCHLVDFRYAFGDTLTNHFLSIKEKITGEQLDKYRIEAHTFDENKGLTTIQIRFKENKEKIVKDIEDLTSYQELNNKYFFYASVHNFKEMFDKLYPMYIGKIRQGSSGLTVTKVINENKTSFLNCVNMGYDFKRLNKEFDIYGRATDLKRTMLRHEPIIAKMILENESKS